MEAASVAMARQDYHAASMAIDSAVSGIESVFSGGEAARRARSLWHAEGCKIFKGEPYERVMAYYYRGLLHLLRGEKENARACYRSGMLQDAFAEEEQHRCDFALMLYMELWCSLHLGDTDAVRTAARQLRQLRPDCPLPSRSANVLIVAETGTAPRKLADGIGQNQLVYRRGKGFAENRVIIAGPSTTRRRMYALEDIYMQACTRGGRQVDRILEGKLVFRETRSAELTGLSALGEQALLAAPLASTAGRVSTLQCIGGGISAVGSFCGLLAVNAKPHADTRYWHGLPDAVHVSALTLPPGQNRLLLCYQDKSGRPLPGSNTSVTVQVPSTGSVVVRVKSPGALGVARSNQPERRAL